MLTRAAHLLSHFRPPSALAHIHGRTMSTFILDKQIFNPTLYRQIQNVWFEGHTPEKKEVDKSTTKRWFMLQGSERNAFDTICRTHFGDALESIGPDVFPGPNADPFLLEIHETAKKNPLDDGAEAAWTALSFVLLLDQISRNLYRTNSGLREIYTHYDRIAFTLVSTLLSPNSPILRPDLHLQFKYSIAHRLWFYMPLMHSEDLSAHRKVEQILVDLREELEKEGGYEGALEFLGQGIESEKEHLEIIERFGRYPHRNGALERETTEEERGFLVGGGATFGVAQDK